MALGTIQIKVLVYLPMAIGPMSAICSGILIYSILTKRNFHTFHRLLLGMGGCDIFYSLFVSTSTVLAPKETNVYGAMGNDHTCSLKGFVTQTFGFATPAYNFTLCLYYLGTIKYGITESKMARAYEPYMHGMALGLPLGTALFGLVARAYGVLESEPGSCWWGYQPYGCMDDPLVECTNEKMVEGLRAASFLGFLVVASGIIITNWLLYQSVRLQMKRAMRSSMVRDTVTKRIRAVGIQCGLYVLAFFLTYSLTAVLELIYFVGLHPRPSLEKRFYWLKVLTFIFNPSQGVLNLLIYLRPRFNTLREGHPSKNLKWILQNAVRSQKCLNPEDSAPVEQPSSPNSKVSFQDDENNKLSCLEEHAEMEMAPPKRKKSSSSKVVSFSGVDKVAR